MKKILFTLMGAFIAVASLNVNAMNHQGEFDYQGNRMSVNDFEAAVHELKSALGWYPPYWRSSGYTCNAYTVCPNGRTISCQTYGYNYSALPYHMTGSCRWMVVPGRMVRCQGYGRTTDFYGRASWGMVDIPVSCW